MAQILLEPLHRGLVTALDPSMLQQGELQRADGAKYRPRDNAVWEAEGRAKLGGGGHGYTDPITQMVGLSWDPGSFVSQGSLHELKQLLYIRKNGAQINTVPLPAGPVNSDASDAVARRTPLGGTEALGVGNEPLEMVALAGDNFLLSGGTNIWIRRLLETGQQYRHHGMPPQTLVPTFATTVPGALTPYPNGYHYFWFTWFDTTTGREGTAEAGAAGFKQVTAVNVGTITVLVNVVAFDAAKPSWANAIRVYRAQNQPTQLANPWPIGWRIDTFVLNVAAPWATVSGTDYVLSSSTYEGTTNDGLLGLPIFDFVEIAVDDQSTFVGLNGLPPQSSTGDVFEESLVLNDIADPRKVRFSFPNTPQAFPGVYYINFETRDTDQVIGIRTLGSVLGVWLINSVWRVNWLPRQADVDFGRGRIKDSVSDDIGLVNKSCLTTLTFPRFGTVAAWVAKQGLFMTDLFKVIELSPRIDWPRTVKRAIALVNNATEFRLELYYDGFNEDNLCLYFHYHETQLVDGAPVVMGPIHRPAGVAMAIAAATEGGKVVMTSDLVNNIHYEGFGFVDEGDNSPQIIDVQTREIYAAGAGMEFPTERLLAHVRPSGFGAGTYVLSMNLGPNEAFRGQLVPMQDRAMTSFQAISKGEFATLRLSGSPGGAGMAVNWLGFSHGEPRDVAR